MSRDVNCMGCLASVASGCPCDDTQMDAAGITHATYMWTPCLAGATRTTNPWHPTQAYWHDADGKFLGYEGDCNRMRRKA